MKSVVPKIEVEKEKTLEDIPAQGDLFSNDNKGSDNPDKSHKDEKDRGDLKPGDTIDFDII